MTLLQNDSVNLKTARECGLNRYPETTNFPWNTLLMSSNYRRKYTFALGISSLGPTVFIR